jgi:Rad52/22 family double-strand break repair protein
MQQVNGVERAAATATSAVPAIENGNDPIALPPELIAKLREPLPPEAVSPNPQRPGLSVIKVIYVVERLNEVFGLNGWRVVNEVVENGHMVVVKGALKIPKYNIHIEQYGGNDNPDRGDAYKGACTDALSKCASYLGIGMDVYKGLHDDRLKNGSNPAASGCNGTGATVSPKVGRSGSPDAAHKAEPTGLTSRNMAGRFSSVRSVLGAAAYDDILGRHGYREVTNIPSLEKARAVYRDLLNAFRERFGEAMRTLGTDEYGKILSELRLSPNVKLSPEQAVLVFNHMEETLNARL